ncbi:MAG: class I SAM-dependent methyltransferase, partial [Candidatus Omnitrophica bacterium]|nr:class I SAM-dependent methyltransferase [Candidatus Omnitrophota bacterium]
EFNVNGICEDAISFLRNNNKKYDVIIAFDVVEHFNKEEIVVLTEYIYNSLKDAGIFIMRVPYGGSLGGLYIRYSGFTHEVAFTELSIEELFRTVGFNRIICIPEPDIHPNLIKSSIKKIINKIIVKALGLPMKDPNFIRSINIIGIGFK